MSFEGHVSTGLTRKQALTRFGLIATAGFLNVTPRALGASAPTAGVTAERVRTLRALAGTHPTLPDRLGASRSTDLGVALKARLRDRDQRFSDWALATLDALELAPKKGRFSDLDVAGRVALFRSFWDMPDPVDQLFQPRPKEASDWERVVAAVKANGEKALQSDLEMDPQTLMPRHFKDAPGSLPTPPDVGKDPLGTEVRRLRYLEHASRELLAITYSDTAFVRGG